MLCAKFGWNCPSGSKEEDENEKTLQERRRQWIMAKFWSEKLTWTFGSGEQKINNEDATNEDRQNSHRSLLLRWAKK